MADKRPQNNEEETMKKLMEKLMSKVTEGKVVLAAGALFLVATPICFIATVV